MCTVCFWGVYAACFFLYDVNCCIIIGFYKQTELCDSGFDFGGETFIKKSSLENLDSEDFPMRIFVIYLFLYSNSIYKFRFQPEGNNRFRNHQSQVYCRRLRAVRLWVPFLFLVHSLRIHLDEQRLSPLHSKL